LVRCDWLHRLSRKMPTQQSRRSFSARSTVQPPSPKLQAPQALSSEGGCAYSGSGQLLEHHDSVPTDPDWVSFYLMVIGCHQTPLSPRILSPSTPRFSSSHRCLFWTLRLLVEHCRSRSKVRIIHSNFHRCHIYGPYLQCSKAGHGWKENCTGSTHAILACVPCAFSHIHFLEVIVLRLVSSFRNILFLQWMKKYGKLRSRKLKSIYKTAPAGSGDKALRPVGD